MTYLRSITLAVIFIGITGLKNAHTCNNPTIIHNTADKSQTIFESQVQCIMYYPFTEWPWSNPKIQLASSRKVKVLRGIVVTGYSNGQIDLRELYTYPLKANLNVRKKQLNELTISISSCRELIVSKQLSSLAPACIWKMQSGSQLAQLNGHKAAVSSVGMSADGKFVVSGSSDGIIRVWNCGNQKLIRSLPSKGQVTAVTFSPNNEFIAAGMNDGSICVWNWKEMEDPILTLLKTNNNNVENGVSSIAVTADGKYIISTYKDGSYYRWDVETGNLILALENNDCCHTKESGSNGRIISEALSADGQFVVSCLENCLSLWDLCKNQSTSFNVFLNNNVTYKHVQSLADNVFIVSTNDGVFRCLQIRSTAG